jgi:hypothetical protein
VMGDPRGKAHERRAGSPAVASVDETLERQAQEGIGRRSLAVGGTDPLSEQCPGGARLSFGQGENVMREIRGDESRDPAAGENPCRVNPKGVTGMKQGRKVQARSKPSRG